MEISLIKSSLLLSDILVFYGIKVGKSGVLSCPFHEDKAASMQFYGSTQTCYCFAAGCKTAGKSLDVIDFVLHKEGLNKHQALLRCVELINGGSVAKTNTAQTPEKMIYTEKLTLNVRNVFLEKLFYSFRTGFNMSQSAQEYARKRCLNVTSGDFKLEIGYNSGQFHIKKSDFYLSNCEEFGLISVWTGKGAKQTKTYQVFGKYSLCFALKNAQKEVTGLYFRSILDTENAKHFYLKESKGLYPKYPSISTRRLIITESIIDAASLLQIGSISTNYDILAAYGTNRLTEEAQNAIIGLEMLCEVIFAFDMDEAGKIAAQKYAEILHKKRPDVAFSWLDLPCKDVNETLVAYSSAIFEGILAKRVAFSFSPEKETEIVAEKQAEILPKKAPEKVLEKSAFLNSLNANKLVFESVEAVYCIKGGVDKVMNKLQITLEISVKSDKQNAILSRIFKLDLYEQKQVEKCLTDACELLNIQKNVLVKDFQTLTKLLDNYRENVPQNAENDINAQNTVAPYILNPLEKEKAMQLAQSVDLLLLITENLTKTGIIGELLNKTFLFVVAASHIQENPLNALIQGTSGSGKTNLLKAIYKIMPEESKKIYSRCSEKMLYNVPKYYFKNKLVCFEDVDGLGEEAQYAWRELVSSNQLISGVSFKDEKGNIGIKELCVYGPITSIACTTKGGIYTDNMSRLFLIAIDESQEQTQKINAYQAQEAAGQINRNEQKTALELLCNYIRLLSAYQVHNPYATFLHLPEGIRDERRLYRLYLNFIDMITVLHQFQRKKTAQNKLIATISDCQAAKDLMFECIMLKMDELDGSLRQFFERLKEFLKEKQNDSYSFTQKEVRSALNISKTHLFRFISELKQLEYLRENAYSGSKGSTYQIRYWDDYQKVRLDVKTFLQAQIDSL